MTLLSQFYGANENTVTTSKWTPAYVASLLLMLYIVLRAALEATDYFAYDSLFDNPLVPDQIKEVIRTHIAIRLVILFFGLMCTAGFRFTKRPVVATISGIMTLIVMYIVEFAYLKSLTA